MSSLYGGDKSTEFVFQNDMIQQLLANGWLLGDPKNTIANWHQMECLQRGGSQPVIYREFGELRVVFTRKLNPFKGSGFGTIIDYGTK